MKEIWKEFFRLKKKEIGSWWRCLDKTGIYVFSFAIYVLSLIAVNVRVDIDLYVNPWVYTIIWFPTILACITFLVWIIHLPIKCIVKLCKWLKSNWKQAKRNVEGRNERPKTA